MTLEEFIIKVFVTVDDLYAQEVAAHGRLRRRGPEPGLCDSEVITMMVVGEFQGIHDDKRLWEYFREHWLGYFPGLGSRSGFVTQLHLVCVVVERMRQRLGRMHQAYSHELHVIDGVPLPICAFARAKRCRVCEGEAEYGYCAAKKQTFYGFKGHLTINGEGCIAGVSVAPANADERDLAPEITQNLAGWLLGDKGYIRPELKDFLAGQGLKLLTPPRKNMPNPFSDQFLNWMKNQRRLIETVIGQLTERFGLNRIKIKDFSHLLAKIFRKLFAHTLSFHIAGSLNFDSILANQKP